MRARPNAYDFRLLNINEAVFIYNFKFKQRRELQQKAGRWDERLIFSFQTVLWGYEIEIAGKYSLIWKLLKALILIYVFSSQSTECVSSSGAIGGMGCPDLPLLHVS